jgi:hypothetical protein
MDDAKNWRLNKERQSLKERRVRVESAEREGGPQPQHGQTRREERQWAASVQRQRSVQSSPMRKKNGLRLCDQDVGQRKTEGMCDHGPIKTRLCTAKHWGGERAEEGGRADFRAATVLFHCPASNGSCPRREQARGPVRGKWIGKLTGEGAAQAVGAGGAGLPRREPRQVPHCARRLDAVQPEALNPERNRGEEERWVTVVSRSVRDWSTSERDWCTVVGCRRLRKMPSDSRPSRKAERPAQDDDD